MFSEDIDAKAFSELLLERVLYSSSIGVNENSINISLEKCGGKNE